MTFCEFIYVRAIFAVLFLSGVMFGCSFSDPYEACGLLLHFTYDYNMVYADAAPGQVDRIDVLVFDADEKYMFTRTADRNMLDNNDFSLSFFEDLSQGTYTFLTWGGLSDDFRLFDARTSLEPVAGETSLVDVRVELTRLKRDRCDAELHPLWYGAPLRIDYDPRDGRRVYDIGLMKNTNHFNIALTEDGISQNPDGELLPYTFEIVSTAGDELYDFSNEMLGKGVIHYFPFRTSTDGEEFIGGEISTGRLMAHTSRTLIVRSAYDQRVIWEKELVGLLMQTKPDDIPTVQEYLDRQDYWSLIFYYNYKNDQPDVFTAVSVVINGWTIWFQDTDL